MKIIIVGAGRTGSSLIRALSEKNYDITVIDKQKSVVDAVTDQYNVSGVVGSGAAQETLLKAGADTADILIALTSVDEINILCCVQAKSVGTVRTAARVFQPDFTAESKTLKKEQSIDYIFNPKYDMADEAARSIGLPGIVRPERLFVSQMQMVTVTVLPESPLNGKTLSEIRQEIDRDLLVASVLREDRVHIPDGTFRIMAGDSISIVAKKGAVIHILQKIGIVKNPVRKVMIVGGGVTAGYLIDMLLKEKKSITVIEADLERCRELMERYPSVTVSCAVGEMDDILESENIASMDAVISLTNSDETNLVTSMYAWARNVPSILTRIETVGHLSLLCRVNLDITLSAPEISVHKLNRFIHNYEVSHEPNEIEKYCFVCGNEAELMQFTAGDSFRMPDIPFGDSIFRFRKNVAVVFIIRGDEMIIPNETACIRKGDRVIVAAEKKNRIESLNDILA